MRKVILVAGDNIDSRQVMQILLEIFGYQVIEAKNGEHAVKTALDRHPDLILMDLSMPVMDGLTAPKAIRNSDEKSQIPIIAVTASGKDYDNQAIKAGCDGLISEPVYSDALQTVIEKYLT